jgi:hypothetical protein
MMRYGENPLRITRLIKDKIWLERGFGRVGGTVLRSPGHRGAIHGVGHPRTRDSIATIVILLILFHLRSVFVVILTPLDPQCVA